MRFGLLPCPGRCDGPARGDGAERGELDRPRLVLGGGEGEDDSRESERGRVR